MFQFKGSLGVETRHFKESMRRFFWSAFHFRIANIKCYKEYLPNPSFVIPVNFCVLPLHPTKPLFSLHLEYFKQIYLCPQQIYLSSRQLTSCSPKWKLNWNVHIASTCHSLLKMQNLNQATGYSFKYKEELRMKPKDL